MFCTRFKLVTTCKSKGELPCLRVQDDFNLYKDLHYRNRNSGRYVCEPYSPCNLGSCNPSPRQYNTDRGSAETHESVSLMDGMGCLMETHAASSVVVSYPETIRVRIRTCSGDRWGGSLQFVFAHVVRRRVRGWSGLEVDMERQ